MSTGVTNFRVSVLLLAFVGIEVCEARKSMTPKERFINDSIDSTLRRHGLPCDGPLKKELQSRAEIYESRDPEVRFRTASEQLVTLDTGLDELRSDPNFTRYFPPERTHVSRFDENALRDNFEAIRRGEVEVR